MRECRTLLRLALSWRPRETLAVDASAWNPRKSGNAADDKRLPRMTSSPHDCGEVVPCGEHAVQSGEIKDKSTGIEVGGFVPFLDSALDSTMGDSVLLALLEEVSLARVLLSLVLSTAAWFLYSLVLHPLSSIPGPLSARLGLPTFLAGANSRGRLAQALRDAHDTYGSVVRIGPNHVIVTDTEAVQTIYAHGSKYVKSNSYKAYRELPWAGHYCSSSCI